jgi:hypothetical protein
MNQNKFTDGTIVPEFVCKAHAALMALPLDLERQRLSDRVRLQGDALASRASKFLTLHAEYAQRRTFAKQMQHPPANVYPSWCKPTVQTKAGTRFPEVGCTEVEYVKRFEQLNNLFAVVERDARRAA